MVLEPNFTQLLEQCWNAQPHGHLSFTLKAMTTALRTWAASQVGHIQSRIFGTIHKLNAKLNNDDGPWDANEIQKLDAEL